MNPDSIRKYLRIQYLCGNKSKRTTTLIERLAACFSDYRKPELIEHGVRELVAQRVLGLCLGYEDLNDHDTLCRDGLLSVMVGQNDVKGLRRRREEDQRLPLASSSTLNRLD